MIVEVRAQAAARGNVPGRWAPPCIRVTLLDHAGVELCWWRRDIPLKVDFAEMFAHRTSSVWAQANPVLAGGEVGVEADTGKAKRGNGRSRWNDLPYLLNQTGWSTRPISNSNAAARSNHAFGQAIDINIGR